MLANEVLSFIEENDVKFIRLAFTDLFGRLRNIAILPDQLAPALESGVAIDATAVPGCAAAPGGSLLLLSRSGYAVHFALAAPVRAGMPAVMRPGYAAGRFLFHGQPRAS